MRVATLPDFDVRHWRNTWLSDLVYEGSVYGILAAPPCTEFSVAKGNRPRDFKTGLDTVRACMEIIWESRLTASLKFWALENPRGFLRQFLGVPHFTFEHWQYGAPQIKPTDIWGYFKEPSKLVNEKPPQLAIKNPNGRSNGRGWSNPKCPREYAYLQLHRAAIRAITPAKFARAFFKANS